MFTGLIETIGTVAAIERRGRTRLIGIRPDAVGFDVSHGASVAVDGACLTLECAREKSLFFTAVEETLDRTTLASARPGTRVNLERALVAGGRFDGHLVLGHVDGVGEIVSRGEERGGERRTIRVPRGCEVFMAEKGSVAIDGVSLTVAGAFGDEITVALVPRTIEATTLARKRAGDTVNVEADVIARYLYKMVYTGTNGPGGAPGAGGGLLDLMERSGF